MTVSGETLRSISAPDQLHSRLGRLDFVDGFASPGTGALVYDHLDLVPGLNAYLNGFPGASTVTPREGLHEAGARAGSQAHPTPAAAADDDGSTTVVFSPERPADTPEGNWIQTTECKGWFAILRLYSPLPSYLDKTWRPSEIELLA